LLAYGRSLLLLLTLDPPPSCLLRVDPQVPPRAQSADSSC
jgi:hypothetical protein